EFGKPTDVLSRIVNKIGDNTLTFKALAKVVDPSKDVVEGTFSAISNFRITYE
ncbi:type 1 fimbrial protein, partial [Escherichia coli]|nr:type 1 fimbrial protein [Escherichia coli]